MDNYLNKVGRKPDSVLELNKESLQGISAYNEINYVIVRVKEGVRNMLSAN